MVAESTVILAPMSQLGCVKASFTVALCISSTFQSLKAPPEAVRMILLRAPGGKPCRLWKMAECSESAGIMSALYSSSRGKITGPPAMRVSLFARAMVFPFLMASMVGRRPAQPTIPVTTVSAELALATAQFPSWPLRISGYSLSFTPMAESLDLRSLISSSVATETTSGLNCLICLAKSSVFAPAASPATLKFCGLSSTISRV
mmetsp:Transcript_10264/g.15456  ORF Transcript_10264/g.15456 Transcript_10264/m.15456 type:complete len:204 (-) Transcript_10264:288-899(-)